MVKSSNLKEKEIEALYFLRQYHASKSAVSFSGGKDSLVALHLAYRVGIRRAVYSDTTVEPSKMIDYIKDIETIFGSKIDIVRPHKSFWELLPIFGPPSTHHRWCCPTIKYPQLSQYAKNHGIKYYITGLRKNESIIRMRYTKVGKNPMIPYVTQLNPIIDWNQEEVWEYIKKYNLPVHPYYKAGLSRNGCVICPYKSTTELKKLKKLEPDIWSKYEKFLHTYADIMDIPNKKEFVEKGWRSWRPPTKRKIVGDVEITDNFQFKITNGLSKERFNLLGILENNHQVLLTYTQYKNKLRIIIEKELNCVGCGACISLCPTNALYINNNNKIDVNLSKCKHCYECLNTSNLRGACIGRTYSLETFIVKINDNQISNC